MIADPATFDPSAPLTQRFTMANNLRIDPAAAATASAAAAASATPFYKDPINLAVAAGGVLAVIGGWMLFGKKKR